MKSIIVSHKGKRETNQDFVTTEIIAANSYLYLVVDGMGGYEHGAEAAELVANSITQTLREENNYNQSILQNAVDVADTALLKMKEERQSKMGATLGGIILTEKKAHLFWLGDVRLFYFKSKKLDFESKDHSLLNEMKENKTTIHPDKIPRYKNIVTKSISGNPKLSKISYCPINRSFNNDEFFMLCSDGVHDVYDSLNIQHELNSSQSIEDFSKQLESVLLESAKDNFSFIISYF